MSTHKQTLLRVTEDQVILPKTTGFVAKHDRGSILVGAIIAMVLVVIAYFVYDSMIQAARQAGKKDLEKGTGKAMKKFVEGDMQGMSQAFAEEGQLKELTQAVSENRLEDVQDLLSPGIDLDRRNSSGYTLLHRAVSNDSIPIVRLLIEHKAALNIADNNGSCALHISLMRKPANPKMVELLLGADLSTINTADKAGMTPLHLAVQDESADCVKVLLKFGADVSRRNQAKQTPLALAKAANDSKITELLTAAGANK